MPAPLLATKRYIPPWPPDGLRRPHLTARLEDGLRPGCPLLLVCAPAGYGKTTLLSEWLAAPREQPLRVAWLSLEPADNDPLRFFAYLAAALDGALPGARALVDDLLAAPRPPTPLDLAAALAALLAGQPPAPGALVVALDDYHVIHEAGIHAALRDLLEHLPPSVHLALATRSDPPLPLHRLRARGQLVELRLRDLRFDPRETAALLQAWGGAPLSPQQADLAAERTEGWAAGLRLLSLSAHGGQNLDAVLQNLSGSQRYILDYLSEEALQQQSPAVQDFLIRTAILERLCAPLCEALTGCEDAQSVLESLEAANCFLIPLDDTRTWYRYHHLFADLLRVRLKNADRRQPGLIAGLHRRAAGWLAGNDASEEAIQHALQAGDFERAAEIVEQNTPELLARGHLHRLQTWIGLLPEGLAAARPWLMISQAWVLAFRGRIAEAGQILQGLPAAALDGQDARRMAAEAHAIRTLMTVTSGDLPQALALIAQPPDLVPPEAGFARSVQCWGVGYALRMAGDLPGAAACFEEVLQIGFALDNLWTIVTASVDLGAVLRQQGDLAEAEQVYRAGLARAYQSGGGPGFVGRLESFLAYLLYERGLLDEAAALMQHAIAHNRLWQNPNHDAYARMVQARIFLAQGQAPAAAALAGADAVLAHAPVVPPLLAAIESARVRAWLAAGDLPAAQDWLARHPLPSMDAPQPISEMDEVLRIAAARVRLAVGQPEAARALLLPLEQAARRAGKIAALVETLVLLARAETAPEPAGARLREALRLGLPRGFRQVFLEEALSLAPILELCRDAPGASELLAQLRAAQRPPAAGPLTARELEILRWVAAGLSNAEIGARCYLAPGTVKAHTAAIYRKLDVANRAEAIARAKDLGLV